MKVYKNLSVPLSDILLQIGDSFEMAGNSQSARRERKHQQKRKREKEHPKIKEEDSEEDNSFKENQESEMSEFEKMAKKNREEREAFLQSLKIDEIKEELKKTVQCITPKPKKTITFKKHKEVVVTPLRKSSRLAKLDIDLSEQSLYTKLVAAEVPSIEKKLPFNYPFEEAISAKEDCSKFVSGFDFTIEKDTKCNLDFASHFKEMNMGESSVAKIVPSRISSLAIHPACDKIMVMAGSKNGHLGFWNVSSSLHPILFLPHLGGITNLKVNPYNLHQLISSSYDGTLRCCDMKKESFDQIYDVSDETCCTYFDFVSATTFLVSQRDGNVSVLDVRTGSLNSEKKHKCHDYAVKTVHVHPGNKNLFLTADSKGNMKLWDLRKLQKKSLINICHHKRSIASAFFSPASGKYILTTSADDSLCIFDSSNLEEEILHKKSIKHNNFTGRWLTPFKATWLPHSDELFSVGSMLLPRRIEVFNSNGNNVFNFTNDEYLNSVTSVNEFHPSLNVLAGGNSSGKVFIFADNQVNI